MPMQFWRGNGCLLYVASIAAPAAPTASELAAGIDLSLGINSVTGFSATVNRVNVSVLAYTADLQVNGAAQYADSGFDLIEDDGVGTNTDDVARRNAIAASAAGTAGYWVFSRYTKKAALTTGKKVDVFTGFVATSNKNWSMDETVATRSIAVILTSDPKQDVSVA